jgi:ATP-dependent helicase/nuclease subunit B
VKLFSTSCETLCLGWDAPLLPRAAEVLRQRFENRDGWDLSPVVCVLPSTWAASRLASLLRSLASDHDLPFTGPRIITVGQLPELLYQPEFPIAMELEQTLGWASVLRSTEPSELSPLIPSVPAAEPIGPWLELASTLRRLHEDLSASRLRFADVVEVAETDAEKRRWTLLHRLYERYLASIQQAGLVDPHWARRHAVDTDRCKTGKTVVLIGTSDLSDAVVAMLRALSGDLLAMVAAPQSESTRFNEFGCVAAATWLDHKLPLRDDQWVAAGDVADQATAVGECIADFGKSFSADSVTIGVTDESQVGPVEVELRGCGVKTYRHLGWTVTQTAVGRLLSLTASHLVRRDWQSLAALVRHADVHHYVSHHLHLWGDESGPHDQSADRRQSSSDWLIQLDQLLANHFPIGVGDPLPARAIREYPMACQVGDLVARWLTVFSGPDQSIAAWSRVVLSWLNEVYEAAESPLDERTAMAWEAAARLLERFAELNGQLDLRVSGAVAIEALSTRLADIRISASPSVDEVEILGWLDLALDDAPAMVVMGLNHPFVPGATTNDPFLPGSLRTRLRMADNDRRYARDVYAMHLMLQTRASSRFIVGKTAADRSPTPPSRLLAAADAEDTARRVRQLLTTGRERVVVHHRWDQDTETTLRIPDLPLGEAGVAAVSSMSVTAFRDYLQCPYRFYLRHVLKLKPLDDAGNELAANQFGDLVHAALEKFGLADDRDESDELKIESLLGEHLEDYTKEMYGESASTAVSVQVAQARRRLRTVARRQAERIAAGWKIHASEASVSDSNGAGIEVDGKWMGLKGRFDRIDRHDDGRWAILDYKTHGHRPEKKHIQKTKDGERWIDLKLPLYRMMIPFLGIDVSPPEVELGYFNIADKEEETRINIAEFSEPQMSQAEELIRDCVRRIHAGDFAPTDERVQYDDYGMILQTGVASRLLDQAALAIDEVGT